MKTITLAMCLFLSACATTYHKQWTVHPDDMPRFNTDTLKCQQDARAANSLVGGGVYDNYVDYCLQKIGYHMAVERD